jgi:choline dehydrogenase-like flavoprotein
MARRLYTDEGGFLTEDRSMSIAFGRAYGGSTVVYTGTSLTITEPTVDRWGVPALGRYFTCHPALILVAQHERPITNYHGHPKSYYCDHFAGPEGFLLETCMYFPFTTAKSLTGFGAEHARMMSAMDRLQMILVLAIDPPEADNRVMVDAQGRPVVRYRFTERVRRSLVRAMRASARVFFAAGAARVHAPAARQFFIEAADADRIDELIPFDGLRLGKVTISSAHPMGGCRMGAGPSDSVTDAWGRVHGLPWLFVADGSLFPRCAEINPYVTIMALADRVSERVRTEWPHLKAIPS